VKEKRAGARAFTSRPGPRWKGVMGKGGLAGGTAFVPRGPNTVPFRRRPLANGRWLGYAYERGDPAEATQ
jgi:hypothetical protein